MLILFIVFVIIVYGLIRLLKSTRINKKWKVLVGASFALLVCVAMIDSVVKLYRWNDEKNEEAGRIAAQDNAKEFAESKELEVGEIHHVNHSDGTLDIEILSIDTIPMPDNAVNIILGFEIYNKSNEYFSPAEIYIQPSDEYGETCGKRHGSQGTIYDPDINDYVDVNQARARMMLDGNPLAAMPHKHYQDELSFFVNRGKNAVIFANTIIGYITLDKTPHTTSENDADEIDYSDEIPEDYVDLNTIFDSNGTCDYNRFRLDELDETQQEYLKQEGIYYDDEQACWRKRK